jgi:hypothetical protein
MLFRLDNPRFIMNAQEFPANVVFYCLAYEDCAGDLIVNFTDPSSSRRVTEPIQPTRTLPILEGMFLHEYVVPFQRLHDRLGRRGSTLGFNFVARSSFRVAGASYGTRTLDITMTFPVNGGGIIRVQAGGQEWDIANPTFDPNASIPDINTSYNSGASDEYVSGPAGINNRRVPDAIIINAYQRAHRGFVGNSNTIEQRRAERLANFDLREVTPQEQAVEASTPPAQTPPRVLYEGVEQRRQDRLHQIQAAEARRADSPNQPQPVPVEPPPEVTTRFARILGADDSDEPERKVSILLAPSRAPKAPPKTRL